jgi:hypothetical protein
MTNNRAYRQIRENPTNNVCHLLNSPQQQLLTHLMRCDGRQIERILMDILPDVFLLAYMDGVQAAKRGERGGKRLNASLRVSKMGGASIWITT